MILSIHEVSPSGAIDLRAANLPYSNLQWSRSFSTCGTFAAELLCPLPVPWPGRYLVTLDGRREVGVVEKAESAEGSEGAPVALSGRFAESLFDRYRGAPGGESASGANWRQAATAALSSWHMGDVPPVRLGAGTEVATGSSYSIELGAGKSAMEAVYAVTSANGAYPLLTYDRDADPDRLVLEIVDGLDRTRGQYDRPICLLSLGMGTANEVSYSGDYSCACSEVAAYAATRGEGGEEGPPVVSTVSVPGFDAASQWEQRAVEDVSSLIGSAADEDPSPVDVAEGGRLRAYDHMPSVSADCSALSATYRELWDLGDLVEVEMPSLGLVAEERVEEAREVLKPEGATVEATVGTKRISKVRRALMGRR